MKFHEGVLRSQNETGFHEGWRRNETETKVAEILLAASFVRPTRLASSAWCLWPRRHWSPSHAGNARNTATSMLKGRGAFTHTGCGVFFVASRFLKKARKSFWRRPWFTKPFSFALWPTPSPEALPPATDLTTPPPFSARRKRSPWLLWPNIWSLFCQTEFHKQLPSISHMTNHFFVCWRSCWNFGQPSFLFTAIKPLTKPFEPSVPEECATYDTPSGGPNGAIQSHNPRHPNHNIIAGKIFWRSLIMACQQAFTPWGQMFVAIYGQCDNHSDPWSLEHLPATSRPCTAQDATPVWQNIQLFLLRFEDLLYCCGFRKKMFVSNRNGQHTLSLSPSLSMYVCANWRWCCTRQMVKYIVLSWEWWVK